jgi:small subunit ribosomal protein S20
MPVKRASAKSLRQTLVRRARNLTVKQNMKKLNVQLRKALAAKDQAKVKETVTTFVKALDKAAQHGIIHRNAAARKKSRILASLKSVA